MDPLPGGEDDPNRKPEVQGSAAEQRQVDRLSGELKVKADAPDEWVRQEEARLKKDFYQRIKDCQKLKKQIARQAKRKFVQR